MRRWMKMLLLGALFAVLLCGSALAVGEKGMYDVTAESGYSLTAQTANQESPTTQKVTIGDGTEKDVLLYAERLSMTVPSPADGTEYLVFVLSGTSTIPTEENIVYIDQKSGAEVKTEGFNLYPSSLDSGIYTVCMSTSDPDSTIQTVGTFQYYASYKRGDANGDGKVNGDDSVAILRYVVHLRELSQAQRIAADVTGDARVNGDDSVKILRWIVRLVNNL